MTDWWPDTKRAIAKVTCSDPDSTGAAFFIGGNHVLTALHVIADVDRDPPKFASRISLQFLDSTSNLLAPTQARLFRGMWDLTQDWAVLECDKPPLADPIAPGPLPARDQPWISLGFPAVKPDGMTIAGAVSDPESLYGSAQAIQLSCKQAEAGQGMALHGISGAPCIIDGKACGLLRATPLEVIIDGRRDERFQTAGGTVYACPSHTITEALSAKHQGLLTGPWDASPGSLLGREFVVFLSDAEGLHDARLKSSVEQADRRVSDLITRPVFVRASEYLGDAERLREAIRALCRAKVVIFDATGFEPACMFLMGIRAVVRKGVTILSVGGNYRLGAKIDIPFNITEVNIVAHSDEQAAQGPTPFELLSRRIRRGLQESGLPHYSDLPVYETLRKLPAVNRGVIPKEEGVLVLCSFDEDYTRTNWNRIKQALQNELDIFREENRIEHLQAQLGVARTFDLVATRLVSQSLYEKIRTVAACVVDFSRWSESVVFEAGVRIAASPNGAAALIEHDWEARLPVEKQVVKEQYLSLISLFDAGSYRLGELDAFSSAYGNRAATPPRGIGSGEIHRFIEEALDLDGEPASRPVFRELADSAKLFAPQDAGGGKFKPVGLYPGNRDLVRREEVADFERLAAAWLYLLHRYGRGKTLEDDGRRSAAKEIVRALLERHDRRCERELGPDAKKQLGEMQDDIKKFEEQHADGRPGQNPGTQD